VHPLNPKYFSRKNYLNQNYLMLLKKELKIKLCKFFIRLYNPSSGSGTPAGSQLSI